MGIDIANLTFPLSNQREKKSTIHTHTCEFIGCVFLVCVCDNDEVGNSFTTACSIAEMSNSGAKEEERKKQQCV